jgi:hypothetical protein
MTCARCPARMTIGLTAPAEISWPATTTADPDPVTRWTTPVNHHAGRQPVAVGPKVAEFHNQTLCASIGWATPAAFGAAIGAPDRRLILIAGEGSHQMTAQEISQFGRPGCTRSSLCSPSCLVTESARSWQSGGQGRAAAAVSWWSGHRRAGGHRLFTANDPEPTGIARLPSGVRDSQSG